MGVVPKSVYRQYNGALRRALKNCQTNICECLADYMERQMHGGDGMMQTWDNMTNSFATRNQMDGHWEKFTNSRNGYQNAEDLFDENGCGNRGYSKQPEMAVMRERTLDDAYDGFREANGFPMPDGGPSALKRVGYFGLGVVGVVGTGLLLLSPFEGPAGEVVAGAATISAFGVAFQ